MDRVLCAGCCAKAHVARGAGDRVGAGGVGSAIAASLAAEGVAHISLYDTCAASAEGLAERLRAHYPQLVVQTKTNDPAGFDVVVNATPLGMNEGDPLPFDVTRIDPAAMVGEVVMKPNTRRCCKPRWSGAAACRWVPTCCSR